MKGEDGIILLSKSMELKESKWIEGLLYLSSDVRESMVADLRTQILGKAYEIETEQVAEKIIQHGFCIFVEPQGE